jgi:hypothetical protein
VLPRLRAARRRAAMHGSPSLVPRHSPISVRVERSRGRTWWDRKSERLNVATAGGFARVNTLRNTNALAGLDSFSHQRWVPSDDWPHNPSCKTTVAG